jgi:hypothetical protein
MDRREYLFLENFGMILEHMLSFTAQFFLFAIVSKKFLH